MDLKKQLIKLGAKKKNLQTHIRPLLEEIDRQKKAGVKLTTDLFFEPARGSIQKLNRPRQVDSRETCPYCMKPLGNSGKVVATSFDLGAEGAHLKCLQREGYRVQ